jgi:cell division protein ZapA (FtsZ GTPase activity inhibitor)
LATEAQHVVVEILGRSLTLQSSMDPERLKGVVQMVDEHLRQLQKAFPASPLADLAILAALNLACESLESKEDYQELQTEIDRRSRQLLERLEIHASYVPPGP